jgi:hypothetical protein
MATSFLLQAAKGFFKPFALGECFCFMPGCAGVAAYRIEHIPKLIPWLEKSGIKAFARNFSIEAFARNFSAPGIHS